MKKPYWKNKQFWICPKHLPSVRLPASIAACWYAGCSSRRPQAAADTTSRPARPQARTTSSGRKRTRSTISNSTPTSEVNVTPTTTSVTQESCAWIECDKGPNGTRNVARKRSKYCSRDCSNRNARANYNARSSSSKKK